jgi:hypothetical protein
MKRQEEGHSRGGLPPIFENVESYSLLQNVKKMLKKWIFPAI